MKVSNGYVWSSKYKAWRKLPRRVWLKIQHRQILRAARKDKSQDQPNRGKS